jgi:hypothetical protein
MATHRCGDSNDGRGWLCVLFDEREERKVVDEASEFEDFAE